MSTAPMGYGIITRLISNCEEKVDAEASRENVVFSGSKMTCSISLI